MEQHTSDLSVADIEDWLNCGNLTHLAALSIFEGYDLLVKVNLGNPRTLSAERIDETENPGFGRMVLEVGQ